MLLSSSTLTRSILLLSALAALGAASAFAFSETRGDPSQRPPVSQAGPGTDPALVAALADGYLTEEEYVTAIETTVACMRAAGFDARIEPGILREIGIYNPGVFGSEQRAAVDACARSPPRQRIILRWSSTASSPAMWRRAISAVSGTWQ